MVRPMDDELEAAEMAEAVSFDFDQARKDIAAGLAVEKIDARALLEELLKRKSENEQNMSGPRK